MVELKFRQAIFRDGKFHHWHYWGYLPKNGCSSNEFVAPITIEQQSSDKTYEVKPSQQYTGLFDKSLITEIYDGDLLRGAGSYGRNRVDEVRWYLGKFVRYGEYQGGRSDIDLSHGLAWFEVIGNIHDNPELLDE